METLQREVTAWEHERNRIRATVDWRFRVADARANMKHVYPNIITVADH